MVLHIYGKCHGRVQLFLFRYGLFAPFQLITVDVRAPCNRAFHQVAIQVAYILHCEVDCCLFDRFGRVHQIDHQRILVYDECKWNGCFRGFLANRSHFAGRNSFLQRNQSRIGHQVISAVN